MWSCGLKTSGSNWIAEDYKMVGIMHLEGRGVFTRESNAMKYCVMSINEGHLNVMKFILDITVNKS